VKKFIIAIIALVLLGAGIYGNTGGDQDIDAYLAEALPEAQEFSLLLEGSNGDNYLYGGYDANILGYVAVSEGYGYGGPLTVVTTYSTDGTIAAITVPKNKESEVWFDTLYQYGFFEQYIGLNYCVPLTLGEDVDAISGATISSNGVAVGVQNGRQVLSEYLGNPYPQEKESINFGFGEILLIIGLLGTIALRNVPILKRIKWRRYITLGYGLVFLGIILSRPLSLTNFTTWIVGIAPHLQTTLFIYILVFSILGIAIFFGKNIYCFWLCPFAAVQEVAYSVGRGGIKPSSKLSKRLKPVRYIVLLFAVFMVLATGDPSVSVFEPWATLFAMSGPAVDWVLLIATLLFSALIYNFWCSYLCPVGAVMDLTLKARKLFLRTWSKKINAKQK
jgi:hypothetical protein